MELAVLIQQAQGGDQAAFGEVCQRFAGLVKKTACQQHLSSVAEDAEAEGWLALAGAVMTYDPDMGVPVAAYLKNRVQFALWNLFKRERRRWQIESTLEGAADEEESAGGLLAVLAAAEQVEEQVARTEIRKELQQAVLALPPRQRQAIVFTVINEQCLQQAAGKMGISLQAVHRLRQRGLAALRTQYGQLSL